MKVAIIGGGFAGLSTAYFLMQFQKISVTLFEASHVGAGASGVCSGLLHPYPGISARRSAKADDALKLAKELIRVAERHTPKKVSTQGGILRKSTTSDQHERLMDHSCVWKDVELLEEGFFFIHTGMTVHSGNYLQGLSTALMKQGLEYVIERIDTLKELDHFDHVVIAAGWGVRHFPECRHLRLKFLKGQALRMNGRSPYRTSFISKGYIAHYGDDRSFDVGSTYEREFADDKPAIEVARELLKEKLKLCPDAEVASCHAGVRVAMENHYLPVIEQLSERVHVFTGLGSRGLLYHGLFGHALAQAIVSKYPLLS